MARRRAVLAGEAAEHESEAYIMHQMKVEEQKKLTAAERKHFEMNMKRMKPMLRAAMKKGLYNEREYYFNPHCGETLDQHITKIKRVPGMVVETRVDRDGFTIVKKKYQYKYKYDIDEIAKLDPKEIEHEHKLGLEKLIKKYVDGRGRLDEESMIKAYNEIKEREFKSSSEVDPETRLEYEQLREARKTTARRTRNFDSPFRREQENFRGGLHGQTEGVDRARQVRRQDGRT